MTVTLPVKLCASSRPFTSPHDHHTSPLTDKPPVTHLTTVTSSHTFLHLPHNHHTSLSTDSPLLGLSHFLSSVTPSWWQSCIPYYVQQLSHFTDSFHPSQMPLTLSSQPSYFMYIFHTSLITSQFSNNSHTSPSNFHTSHTLIIPTPLQLPKHILHDSHLSNNCYIFMTTFTPS